MPELPEVETVRRGLERTIVGKTAARVEIRNSGQFRDGRPFIEQFLVGARVTSVERRAKILLVHFSSGWVLAIHLKMTGQIIVAGSTVARSTGFTGGHPEKAYEQLLPNKHTHVVITFTDGTVLYFNDLRKFGWLRLLPRITNQELRITGPTIDEFLASMNHGPEPLGDEFTVDHLYRQAKKRLIAIKTFLLDQSVVAGVGNIYADEALFAAQIRPTRRAKSLTRAEAERLHAAIKHVLELGIEYGGTTLNTYRNVEGTAGRMREYLKVYDREGLPCLRFSSTPPLSLAKSSSSKSEHFASVPGGVVPERCTGVIQRVKIGQRSSHYCPRCQS